MNTKNKLWQIVLGGILTIMMFSCQKDDEEVVPLFKDLYINDIGLFSAKLYSSFETEQTNFIECGFVVSTDEIHSLEDGIKYVVQPQQGGQMQLTLQDLELATEYRVRSYIIQANGGDVEFIQEKRFTTLGLDAIVDATPLYVNRIDTVNIEFTDSIHSVADQLEFFLGENKVPSVVVSPTLIKVVISNDITTDQHKLKIKYKDTHFETGKWINLRWRGRWVLKSKIEWNSFRLRPRSFISENKIYVVNPVENGEMWKYDIDSDEWEKSKNFIGSEIDWGFAISSNGFGYIAGGHDNKLSGLYIFDPYIDTWAFLNDSSLLKSRGNGLTYIKGDKLYIGGGYQKLDLYSYNLSTNEWKPFASPSRVSSFTDNFSAAFDYLFHHSAIVLNNKTYVFGGRVYNENQTMYSVSNLVMNIHEEDSSFVEISAMPERWQRPILFTQTDKIYISPDNSYIHSSPKYYFYEYEPAMNKWTRLSTHHQPGTVYFSHGYNDMGYVGMSDGAGNLTIWEFDPNY